jgi:hypothetical protein
VELGGALCIDEIIPMDQPCCICRGPHLSSRMGQFGYHFTANSPSTMCCRPARGQAWGLRQRLPVRTLLSRHHPHPILTLLTQQESEPCNVNQLPAPTVIFLSWCNPEKKRGLPHIDAIALTLSTSAPLTSPPGLLGLPLAHCLPFTGNEHLALFCFWISGNFWLENTWTSPCCISSGLCLFFNFDFLFPLPHLS